MPKKRRRTWRGKGNSAHWKAGKKKISRTEPTGARTKHSLKTFRNYHHRKGDFERKTKKNKERKKTGKKITNAGREKEEKNDWSRWRLTDSDRHRHSLKTFRNYCQMNSNRRRGNKDTGGKIQHEEKKGKEEEEPSAVYTENATHTRSPDL